MVDGREHVSKTPSAMQRRCQDTARGRQALSNMLDGIHAISNMHDGIRHARTHRIPAMPHVTVSLGSQQNDEETAGHVDTFLNAWSHEEVLKACISALNAIKFGSTGTRPSTCPREPTRSGQRWIRPDENPARNQVRVQRRAPRNARASIEEGPTARIDPDPTKTHQKRDALSPCQHLTHTHLSASDTDPYHCCQQGLGTRQRRCISAPSLSLHAKRQQSRQRNLQLYSTRENPVSVMLRASQKQSMRASCWAW